MSDHQTDGEVAAELELAADDGHALVSGRVLTYDPRKGNREFVTAVIGAAFFRRLFKHGFDPQKHVNAVCLYAEVPVGVLKREWQVAVREQGGAVFRIEEGDAESPADLIPKVVVHPAEDDGDE